MMFKALLLGTILGSAPAAAAVYDTSATTAGNQAWTGTLGLDFHVATPIQITSLGVFDSGKDGITTNISATIFTAAGSAVLSTINFNGTANVSGSAYVFHSITPYNLAVGDYQLAAWGFNGIDQNYNSQGGASSISFDTIGGRISATGMHYANVGVTGVLATNTDGGALRYGAGSFTATAVPLHQPVPPPPPPPPVHFSDGIYFSGDNVSANQAWSGTLGLNFSLTKQIKIYSLGAFAGGKVSISTNIYTAIFDMAGHVVSPTVDFNGTLNASNSAYVFKSVTPFTLDAGTYQLGSWGYNATNGNYNSGGQPSAIDFQSHGGVLTALGTRYSAAGTGGVLGTIVDSGVLRYGAGSLVASVPEPSEWAMMVMGFAFAGLARRRWTAGSSLSA